MLKRAYMLLVLACITVATAWAAENSFVGEWKLNSSKNRTPDEMKVESKGRNTWSFNFAGTPEIIVVDGTDQPGIQGTTLSVRAEALDTWIVVRKLNGKLLIRGTWKLSKDGTTLTDFYREFDPDGSTLSLDYVYQRHGAGSGFAADWQSIKETRNTPLVLEVKAYRSDGLTFIIAAEHYSRSATLGGKDNPIPGPNAEPGSSCSIRQVAGDTLEMTDKHRGNITDTREIKLSPNGKTLTITVQTPGQSQSDVLVFDRQ